MLRNAGCSSRGLRFVPSTYIVVHTVLTPVLRDPVPLSGFLRYQAHKWYLDIHVGKTPMHIKTTQIKKYMNNWNIYITSMVCKLEERVDTSSRKILKALTYNKLK